MPEIRRVLLVGPLAGAGWRSISAYSGSLKEMLESAGIRVDLVAAPWFNPPSIAAGIRARWTNSEQVRDAEAGAYDIVHITDHALAHHIPRFRRQTATLVTCHDVMAFTLPGYFRSRREALLKRTFLRRPLRKMRAAERVIAVSEFTRRELISRYRISDYAIGVVPNVVRVAFHPVPREQAEAALLARGIALPPSPRIVSVGHSQGYKNLPALLEALAQPALAHASLVRVGRPLPRDLAPLSERLGVARRTVELTGLSDDDLAHVYAAGDALAQPSRGEGFGIPVIEAMACGLPVVASGGGALPEVVGEAGIVLPLGMDFPKRFAEAITAAIGDRERLGPAGIERARRFEPRAVLPMLLDSYERALARRESEQ